MSRKKRYIAILFAVAFWVIQPSFITAQTESFQIVKGLPTNEVYDLLIDSKGLLWIAHDQGLSRYDGKTFKHFKCSEQHSRAVTGLVEDKYGRIWCYNFSDQILWVQNDVMHVLKEYAPREGSIYPRVTICGNELFAATIEGLFIYDLDSNKSRYILKDIPINSLAVNKDNIIVSCFKGLYVFAKGRIIGEKMWKKYLPELLNVSLILQNSPKGDTLYGIKGSANCYYRFIISNGDVQVFNAKCADSYINTISDIKNEVWLHTKTKSYNLSTGEQIVGRNISDIAIDREGNYWFSSLKFGLMKLPKSSVSTVDVKLPLRKGDYIRNTAFLANQVIYGTQGGDVFSQDTSGEHTKLLFSDRGAGAIEHLYLYDSNHMAIAPSVGLYFLNMRTKEIRNVFSDMPVKDISFDKNYTLISSIRGALQIAPITAKINDTAWMQYTRSSYYGFKPKGIPVPSLYWKEERCRAGVIVPFNKAILASYRSGLYECKMNEAPKLIQYHGKLVNAATLVAFDEKVFIGTATDNILVYDKKGLHQLGDSTVRSPGSILQIVSIGRQLWIVTIYGIQIVDVSTEKVIGYYELSGMNPASIMDIEKVKDKVLMTFADGVCSLPADKYETLPRPIINLSYVTANDSDIVDGNKNVLPHDKSDLRFYLSAPWYSSNNSILIAYRLKGNADTSWQYMPRNDEPVFYPSLPSGDYCFETRAFHQLSNYSSELVRFEFTIKKPWWKSFAFITSVVLLIIAFVGYVVRRYYLERLEKERRYYEKELAVEKERQRISAEIHDELGGTLSGIRLMTEMTQRKYDGYVNVQNELYRIHTSVSNLTQKLKEVIWSLSNDNNSLENLLDYLLRKGKEIFANSSIVFSGQIPEFLPSLQMKGERRRYIYLAVKDVLQHIVKRDDVKEVSLKFVIENKWLTIIIKDDRREVNEEDMNVKAVQERVWQFKGEVSVMIKKNSVETIFNVPV